VECGSELLKLRDKDITVHTPDMMFPQNKSSGKVLREKIDVLNKWEVDLAIESHFNSYKSSKARGCETLYFSLPGLNRFSKKGKVLAECIQEETISQMELRSGRPIYNRGAKGMASFKRLLSDGREIVPRYAFLTRTKMPAVITEPLFISSEEDAWYLKHEHDEEILRLATGVVNGILKFKERAWVKIK
jgi:N-acetylmuramoyl-L-alanine amidase